MNLHCRKHQNQIFVSGDTYPHRQSFKSLGGRFCWKSKSWVFPFSEGEWDQVQKLCSDLQGKSSYPEEPRSQAGLAHLAHTSQPVSMALTAGETAVAEVSFIAGHEPANEWQGLRERPHENTDQGLTEKIYGISELSSMVADQITRSFRSPIWIVGEIQNHSVKNGHHYLSLAEPNQHSPRLATTINACLWRDRYGELKAKLTEDLLAKLLKDGMKIKIYARLNLYRRRNHLSLEICDIDPDFTEGEIALARQKLLADLQKQGLIHRQKALHLPLFPFHIGLITAEGSRAYSDFVHQLSEKSCGLEIEFVSASMQGARTSSEVRAALSYLEERQVDLVVITRGGGSMADLHWFNDRELAYAITGCKVPVVAAIGHHDDECVVQDVAYKALKTPTATAEYILSLFSHIATRIEEAGRRSVSLLTDSFDREQQRLQRLEERFKYEITGCIHHWQNHLSQVAHKLMSLSAEAIHQHHQDLTSLEQRWVFAADGCVSEAESQITALIHALFDQAREQLSSCNQELRELDTRFQTADPLPWVEAGWAMVFKEGRRVRSVGELGAGDDIDLRLSGGQISAVVSQVELEEAKEAKEAKEKRPMRAKTKKIKEVKHRKKDKKGKLP